MPVTGIYVTDDDQITNYLSTQTRQSLDDDNDPFAQEHLDLAEARVSSYLRRRFQLPYVNPDDAPELRSCALAFMHESMEVIRRRVNEDTAARADQCRAFLEAVGSGQETLQNEEDQVFLQPDAVGESLMSFEDRAFTDGREDSDSNTTKSRIGIEPDFTGVGTSRV